MSFITNVAKTANSFVIKSSCIQGTGFQQVRNKWADWRMLKDYRRRQTCVQYADERLRLNAIRKNTILPVEIREEASEAIHALPRDSVPNRVTDRCAFTSRARGTVHRHRLSRIVWRHYADYNQMSGVMRACW